MSDDFSQVWRWLKLKVGGVRFLYIFSVSGFSLNTFLHKCHSMSSFYLGIHDSIYIYISIYPRDVPRDDILLTAETPEVDIWNIHLIYLVYLCLSLYLSQFYLHTYVPLYIYPT